MVTEILSRHRKQLYMLKDSNYVYILTLDTAIKTDYSNKWKIPVFVYCTKMAAVKDGSPI